MVEITNIEPIMIMLNISFEHNNKVNEERQHKNIRNNNWYFILFYLRELKKGILQPPFLSKSTFNLKVKLN
jgi:hypothetical protein